MQKSVIAQNNVRNKNFLKIGINFLRFKKYLSLDRSCAVRQHILGSTVHIVLVEALLLSRTISYSLFN